MKRWILKAIIQKIISYLPFKYRINYFFQRFVTKGVLLTDDYFINRLVQARNHFTAYHKVTGFDIPQRTLEIGTGWYPIVPISFFIAGSDQIYSIDIARFVTKKSIIRCISKFIEFYDSGFLANYINIDSDRIQYLKELSLSMKGMKGLEILEKLNIKIIVKANCKYQFIDDYFDFIHSNNTFEHIPAGSIPKLIKELYRVQKKGDSVMSHFIDMTDHFAHLDKSISIYNFLKFSERTWKFINNSIQPQNRLRITDYEKIFMDQIIDYEIFSQLPGDIEVLKKVKLSKKFQGLSMESIAVSHCHFITFKR